MRSLAFLALLSLALLRPASAQEKIVFDVREYGGLRLLGGELYHPPGVGPHPTVILLHGCGGVTRNVRDWAARIRDWGYIALIVESYYYRYLDETCTSPQRMHATMWMRDALGTREFLPEHKLFDPVRVVVLGFGHGGRGALQLARGSPPRFMGAIALYPPCFAAKPKFTIPLLVLTGEADDWMPPAACRALGGEGGTAPEIVTYPGVHHGFDEDGADRVAFGHRIRGDAAAAADARERVKRFLDARLR